MKRSVLLAGLVSDLVAGDAHQQLQQLLGLVQVILAGGGPDEEVGQHRLADVRRIQEAPQLRVGQADADGDADGRLVAAHQLRRRRPVPGAHPADEVAEGNVVRHARGLRRCTGR